MTNPTSSFGWVMPSATDLVTDLPADFDVFGQAVDTDFVGLKGGTTGQVLAKASATDLDFVWSADAAGMTNPMTTTADIIYSSSGSTPARLGIGSAADVLTVAGGVPTWAAPAAPATAKSYALLSTTTTSTGSSYTVSGLSGYDEIRILFHNIRTDDTGNNQVRLQLNADTTTANYQQVGWSMTVPSTMTSVAIADPGLKLCNHGTVTSNNINGYVYIAGANTSGEKLITQAIAVSGAGNALGLVAGGRYSSASVISNVTLITAAGSFTMGTMYIYGAV